jgi:NADH-quinone oxidoreductase subunit D
VDSDLIAATGDFDGSDTVINLGPQHPSAHGILRLALRLDGDRISHATPLVGYMHRGAEKLFEARDFRQILVLANRHDWLSAFSNELGIVIAVERMVGLQPPVRATWARTLLAELNRILSHLMFAGTIPSELVDTSPVDAAFSAREAVQQVMEELSGGRVHYMFNQVGGLKQDLPAGWLARVGLALDVVARVTGDHLQPVVGADATLRARACGLGVLPVDTAEAYGVSGPIGRASGLDIDLRRDDPYLAYASLPDHLRGVVIRSEGDVLARFECLVEEIGRSVDIARHCANVLGDLDPGPINVRLPKVVKAPEGATYAWTENPLGINGYYLVSKGAGTPWRLKLRTASFNNIQALPEVVIGAQVRDLVPILASMFFVIGDVDK